MISREARIYANVLAELRRWHDIGEAERELTWAYVNNDPEAIAEARAVLDDLIALDGQSPLE